MLRSKHDTVQYSSNPPGRNNLATQTGGQWTMASNRGPNAVVSTSNAVPPPSALQQNSEYYKAANAAGSAFQWAGAGAAAAPPTPGVSAGSSASGVGGSWATAAPIPPQSQMSVAARASAEAHGTLPVTTNLPAGPAASNGTYEKNLIEELCPPGGMKAEPPPDKLQEFARALPSLNPDCVCPALLDALEQGNPWIMRAKALCVIETVLKVMAQVEGSNAYADFFHACAEEIAPLTNHARAAVKAPAKRVMTLLGLGEGVVGSVVANGGVSQSAAAPAVPVAEAPNLLDFDEPAAPAVAPPVAPPPPPLHVPPPSAISSGGDSLFSGLNTKAAAPTSEAPVQMAPAPSSSAQDGDLLGGLDDITTPPEAVPPTISTPAAPSNDLFGDLSVKSSENGVSETPQQPASAPPSAPSSAFGFMNTTAPPAPPAETPMTPSTPATQTFDPLLSLGTPGSINPSGGAPNPNRMAQIQATMAYQQQMMMMQQQMQQMQMVYAGAGGNYPRQGSGAGVPPLPMGNPRPNVMGANYMRQVPGVQGDKMTSFSFLGTDSKKQENHSFDFVKDAMKKG
ncbi:hypothetical protein HJC23_005959 [Cyclotella cryptica]|uniref:CCR4-NOT transcription complex subunit 11 n=1 Tax=Cyclotella cryptica TaxID=29204 RepID=A0ABD3QZK0_9STRA